MSRIAWFHCFSGIAGDMALGSLLDAGADVDEVTTLLRRLPIEGWRLEVEDVKRAGVGATRALVTTAEAGQPNRHLSDIADIVARATLPTRLAARVMATF